jgi:hypothetical protein
MAWSKHAKSKRDSSQFMLLRLDRGIQRKRRLAVVAFLMDGYLLGTSTIMETARNNNKTAVQAFLTCRSPDHPLSYSDPRCSQPSLFECCTRYLRTRLSPVVLSNCRIGLRLDTLDLMRVSGNVYEVQIQVTHLRKDCGSLSYTPSKLCEP